MNRVFITRLTRPETGETSSLTFRLYRPPCPSLQCSYARQHATDACLGDKPRYVRSRRASHRISDHLSRWVARQNHRPIRLIGQDGTAKFKSWKTASQGSLRQFDVFEVNQVLYTTRLAQRYCAVHRIPTARAAGSRSCPVRSAAPTNHGSETDYR